MKAPPAMADSTDNSDASAASDAANPPQMRIAAQYIKDLSFENPGAPDSLRGESPAIDMAIDVQGRRYESAYEVVLHVEAKAKRGDTVAFIVELKYGGIFQFVNIPESAIEQMLLIEAPRMLFPYARNILSDVTRDGGFPPLFLEPIDFAGLYLAQKQKIQAQGGEGDGQIAQA